MTAQRHPPQPQTNTASGPRRLRALALACAALVGAFWIAPAMAAAVAKEVKVTNRYIIDYEFDWGRDGVNCPTCNFGAGNSRIAYTDLTNKMWVGDVDFETGDFLPADGRGTLVDTMTALPTDFGNGPEWMFSQLGSQLVYTRYQDGQTPGPETAGLGLATQRPDGTWAAGMMENGLGRQSPLGTLDLDDPIPRIQYQDINKVNTFWRAADTTSAEAKIPTKGFNGGSRRWVPTTHKVILTARGKVGTVGAGYRQVFLYDTDTDELNQITNEDADHVGAMMWRAPEFDNDFVFFSVRNGNQIVVHRKLEGSNGKKTWTPIATLDMPAETPYVWSPEYFIYNGKSYIFFQMNLTNDATNLSQPNVLGMMGILPDNSGLQMLTPPEAPGRVRMDPEYFITAKGPYIYYNRYTLQTATTPSVPEGVYRVDTKLGVSTPTIP